MMKFSDPGIYLSALRWVMSLPFNIRKYNHVNYCGHDGDFAVEKQDILGRAEWLYKNIVVEPKQLLDKMPREIGREYQGQWAIYCCSMLGFALYNIARIFPEQQEVAHTRLRELVELVKSPEIRYYDTMMWHEDPLDSLNGNKDHMTYISILAWTIINYKLTGADNGYDELLQDLCDCLKRRMISSKYDLNLLSFPGKQIFLPDMLVAIIALKNATLLKVGDYQGAVDEWLTNAQTKWIHRTTGLLAGLLPGASRYQKGMTVRGSYSALSCSYLTLVDTAFAEKQYIRLKKVFGNEERLFGIEVSGVKEYLRKNPRLSLKPGDSGLVVEGFSTGGTAFALGAATFFGDWSFRQKMLKTADAFAQSTGQGERHYRLSELFMVGEAVALAMRTNFKAVEL